MLPNASLRPNDPCGALRSANTKLTKPHKAKHSGKEATAALYSPWRAYRSVSRPPITRQAVPDRALVWRRVKNGSNNFMSFLVWIWFVFKSWGKAIFALRVTTVAPMVPLDLFLPACSPRRLRVAHHWRHESLSQPLGDFFDIPVLENWFVAFCFRSFDEIFDHPRRDVVLHHQLVEEGYYAIPHEFTLTQFVHLST